MHKKKTVSSQSKYVVRNLHCGAALTHLEEALEQSGKPDSAAGLSSFVFAKFPMLAVKLFPGGQEQLQGARAC